ncbi:Olfactory receptor 1N2 [Bienertia sinuspersici]
MVKVNVDAHIREGRYVALGAMLRDHKGQVLATATRKMKVGWEPEWAEAAAAVFGLRMARALGHSRVHLESDAVTVVNKIKNDTHGLSPMFVFFEEISVLKACFDYFECSHVKEGGGGGGGGGGIQLLT